MVVFTLEIQIVVVTDIEYIEYKHNDDWLRFAVAGSERMRIDSSGRMVSDVVVSTPLSGQDTFVNIWITLYA